MSVELAPGIVVGGDTLPWISGPCVIETEELAIRSAQSLAAISNRLGLPLIYKSSFDKANRSSLESFRGPGLEEGLRILRIVKETTGLAVVTDVHEPAQCERVAEVCDVLQIPAFLCRQTDLLVAAARTGRGVAVKKGQFMAPADMLRCVEKVRESGNAKVVVIERGSSFGYQNLVVDMRSFEWLRRDGIAVIYDITHSLQLPGAGERESGGTSEYAEPLARAAVAAGADGVFLETHPDPDNALCDSAVQIEPERAESLLFSLASIRRTLLAEGPLV
ncbi:MAG: 3-deoxy-8-phosphooctulonate synthase [Acidobacteriota bacterium]|nr:3-deoxy-8-phosphooctulonate synthase [Acidobacteriota bacterium]